MKTAFVGISLFLGFAFNTYSQEKKIKLELQLLSHEALIEVNFNQQEFIGYTKQFINEIRKTFAQFKGKRDVLILQTFHKESKPTIRIYSRPELAKNETKKALIALKSIKATRSRIVDFSLLHFVKTEGGAQNQKAKFIPEFKTPKAKVQSELKHADLATKYKLIKRWAITEVIPILAAFELKVDKKFAGVKAVGEIFKKTDFSKRQDIIKLTDKNHQYWRAILEMNVGNQLIPVSNIFMHISQGEFDYAGMYLDMINNFSRRKSGPYHLTEELNWRLKIFNKDVNKTIKEGIQLHDKEEFDKAIKVYNDLLKIYPNSAWANYELYYSKNTKNLSKDAKSSKKEWDIAKKKIYKCNPLYPMNAQASTGREGYLLFKQKDDFGKDIIKYADIAMDLEVYGFSAQLYWWAFSSIPKKDYKSKNVLSYFLYCLNELGDKEISKNFKGDFKKEFKTIDLERKKAMTESKIYNSFKQKK